MIGEKSRKGIVDSAVHSTRNVASKEPLVERVKRRVKRAAKIGLIGFATLISGPMPVLPQVAMNVPKGAETAQTETNKIITSSCGATLDYINEKMQKLTDQNSIDMVNSMFGKIKPNEGKMDAKFVKGTIYDATSTQPAQKYFMNRLGINENESQKSVKNGAIEYNIAHMDEKGVDLQVHIVIIRGNKVIGTKNNQTEIAISFGDKNDVNSYTSLLSCPEGCEISEIIPFFGKAEGKDIQFGVYYKYTQNGIENEMIGYIFYDTSKGSAVMSYIKKDNERTVSYLGIPFKV